MADRVVSADQFASAIAGIFDEVTGDVNKGAATAIRKGGKVAKEEWAANARGSFGGTGRYAGSISMAMRESRTNPHVEVGSKELPGLPHLLEKGHARTGGGFVSGRQHIAPAADHAFDETMRLLDESIGEALR